MALGLKGGAMIGLAIGVGIGVGLAVMAPSLFPRTARAARPMLRRLAHDGMGAYMRVREGLAEFGEYAEDLLAEVEAELKGQRRGDAPAAATESPAEEKAGA